jgi:hypothetical protein
MLTYYLSTRVAATILMLVSLDYNSRKFSNSELESLEASKAQEAFIKHFLLWVGFCIPLVGEVCSGLSFFLYLIDEGFGVLGGFSQRVLQAFSRRILLTPRAADKIACAILVAVLVCAPFAFEWARAKRSSGAAEPAPEVPSLPQGKQYRLLCTEIGDARISCVREPELSRGEE